MSWNGFPEWLMKRKMRETFLHLLNDILFGEIVELVWFGGMTCSFRILFKNITPRRRMISIQWAFSFLWLASHCVVFFNKKIVFLGTVLQDFEKKTAFLPFPFSPCLDYSVFTFGCMSSRLNYSLDFENTQNWKRDENHKSVKSV